jgi:hypothetical protein
MTRLWTYSTPVPGGHRWELVGDRWRTTIAPTAPEPRMHTDPHTDPPTPHSGDDSPTAASVPDALDAAKELNAEHDRLAPDADIRRGVAVLLGVCQQLVNAAAVVPAEQPEPVYQALSDALAAAAELGITPTDQP